MVDFATPYSSASVVEVSPMLYRVTTADCWSVFRRFQPRLARGWNSREESLTEAEISRSCAAVTEVVDLLEQR